MLTTVNRYIQFEISFLKCKALLFYMIPLLYICEGYDKNNEVERYIETLVVRYIYIYNSIDVILLTIYRT